MLYVRNHADHKSALSENEQNDFLLKCSMYIEKLKSNGQLIAAQPLVKEGVLLSHENGRWIEKPYGETKEVQVGYYHVLANNIQEAIEIAKGNPEFEYGSTARIEVRPVKTKEVTTGYEYPKSS